MLATAYLYHGDVEAGDPTNGGMGMMTIEGAFQTSELLGQALEFVRGQHTTNDATCGVRCVTPPPYPRCEERKREELVYPHTDGEEASAFKCWGSHRSSCAASTPMCVCPPPALPSAQWNGETTLGVNRLT